MIDESFIRNLGIIIVAAAVFLFSTRPLKMPSIVVYLLAGVIVGPVMGLVELSGTLELISEMGIVLLLFLVGLELSLDKIRDVGKVAMLAGLSQVAVTAILGFGFSWMLKFGVMESMFLAAAVTFSSTVVVVKLLDEKSELFTLYGRIAVGIFLVQDLVVIVLLTFLSGYDPSVKMDLASLGKSLGLAFGGMGVLLVVVMGAARFLLARPLAWAARSGETMFVWSLCWCFLVVLLAHVMHLSHEIGAFLAGISLAQLPHTHDLQRRVHPLMNFFIAVFFVSLGVQMDLQPAFRNWGAAVCLSGFVLIGKMLIFVWIITRLGFSRKTSFLTSVTVAQISEFSFILAAMGIKAGLISRDVLSIIALIGLITISVSSYLILYNHQLYGFVQRWNLLGWLGTAREDEAEIVADLKGHVIVIGMNSLGRTLAQRLCARGEQVLAIDSDPHKLAGLPCPTLHGNVDYGSLLDEAGLPQAKLLVTALQVESTNDILAHRARAAGVPSAVHVIDLSVVDNLLDMDVTYLMIPKVDGVKLQNRELERRGLLQ